MVLLAIHCERLSRLQQRLVRCILIADIFNCTLDTLFVRHFDRDNEDDVNGFNKSMFADIMGPVHVVNPSWKISALGSLMKRVGPERFTKKIFFQRGDGLADAEFVKLVGGRAQLETLYASRVGLVDEHAAARAGGEEAEAAADVLFDGLASEVEKEMIALLRVDFQEALDERQRNGMLWPFFFEDIALLRVLRGNRGVYKAARKWFKRFLAKLEEHKVDDMARELSDKFEKNGFSFSMESLPCYDEVKDYCNFVPCAPAQSKSGDFVQFIALTDINRQGILDNVKWESWVRFMRGLTLLRMMYAHAQSQLQGRFVRCTCIYDLSGQSIGSLRMPAFNDLHHRDVSVFMQQISSEILGRQNVINAPWFITKMFHLFSNLVPAKFTSKLHMMEHDGLSDEDFLAAIGGRVQLKQLLATRIGLCDGLKETTAGTQEIAAGSVFERFLDVRVGQRAVWSCQVSSGYGDSLLGTPDIQFTAKFLTLPGVASSASDATPSRAEHQDADEVEDDGQEVAVETIRASVGLTKGSFVADKDGTLMLTWSNEHSTVRGKTVQWSLQVEPLSNDDDEDEGL